MGDLFVQAVERLQRLPPELSWATLVVSCFVSIVLLHRLFGAPGLYAYLVLAMVVANVQVMKAVRFSMLPEPVALGTVVFASSYLATDVLAECHGPAAARRAVLLGFCTQLVFVAMTLLTIGFRPLSAEEAGPAMQWAVENHGHIQALFLQAPALFLAGLAAYLLSQLHDVWLFERLRRRFDGRHKWLRNNVSTAVSALIDNTIFSVLAWIVFAPQPLPVRTVVVTYILGTYWLRLVVALLDTPFFYLACAWRPRDERL